MKSISTVCAIGVHQHRRKHDFRPDQQPEKTDGYQFPLEVLRAKVLFTNAKHKVKKKSFKSGVRENILGYGLPTDETFNKEFLNFGVIIPHGAEK